MEETTQTSLQILQSIHQQRGLAYLREGGGKFFVNAFAEMGGEKQDVRLLRYLTECGAHNDLLDAASLTPAMQRAYYSQTVQKLCDKTLISEALAHRVCALFWQAVYNTQPPVSGPVPPIPQPAKTAEELFWDAQNCNDQVQKVHLLQQAASQGHLNAMLHLGFAYEYGNGIGKDPYEAAKWFRKAAEQGNAAAQDRMAYCFDKGFGVERDLGKAIEWCRKANNQNFPDAARHLRQLEERKRQENPDISGNKLEFDIVNGALLKYNGTASKVTVPGGVTRVGAKAFFGNDAIRSVTLPYGLIGLGAEAFAGCRNLREVIIPGSVIAVNLDVFAGCRKLKKVTLESGVQKLIFGDHLDQLGSVTIKIPDSVGSVTWSHMPESQRIERMKHRKGLVASKDWTNRLQDFFSKNPDFRPGKIRHVNFKRLVLAALAVLLALMTLSFVVGSDSDKRTRSDLKPYNLEDSIEDMLLTGTEEIYTYPDGTWMEFYYDDTGKEIYRVYVNTENEIENLFEAAYDSSGRLVHHQIFDGQGNLLRADSYDFHSNDDIAQRRITLGDGRHFQGQSTFDEKGYETFTLNHQDGTKTVYEYKDGGVLTRRAQYDAEGNSPEVTSDAMQIGIDWDVPKVYGPWQTVMGWINGNNYTRSYVQGLCGGALKEFSVSEEAAFIETYDLMGNLLEEWYYSDGQLNELGSHTIHSYDTQGNYTGCTDTFYFNDGDYTITLYDKNGTELSRETHHFDGEEEAVSYYRYETELDDQGRAIRIQTFDGESGQLKSIEEFEYDSQGTKQKRIWTAFAEDGGYSVYVEDGDGKDLSDAAYYPSGNIRWQTEYTKDGIRSKWSFYYESGQVEVVTKYNNAGDIITETGYYENGQTEFQHEYDAAGQLIRYTMYYETGKKRSVVEYDDQGDVIKSVYYNEDGTVAE